MLCLACACKYSGPRHGVRDTATEYAHSKSLEIDGSSYPAVPVEARVRRSGLYAKGFLHHQLHGVASALQDLSTAPVDGVVLRPSMLGDR